MGFNLEAKSISWISILCSIILMLTYSTTPSLSTQTPYDILSSHNLPKGILPHSEEMHYQFDASTGKISIKLNRPCTYRPEGYTLKFETTMSGVITNDSISNVEGVKVKKLFQWLTITKVVRVKDQLEITALGLSKKSPVSNFLVIKECHD
ncbi:unnamed protein product [Lupinus luteus]|uniref:Uncharacterized protein n=1 Tax=Lupinus luteus TaxID=3873 RepID=A0AAV1YJ97_LUPLU